MARSRPAEVRRWRRAGFDGRPQQRARAFLHELLEVEAGAARQRVERGAEGDLVVLGHEANHVASGAAAEAVEETLARAHREGRRALLMERAGGDELTALPLDRDAALGDHRRQVVRRLDRLDPLFRDLHGAPRGTATLSRA